MLHLFSFFFVSENIPVKFSFSDEKPIKAFFFELNFHKKNKLVSCLYNPNKSNISIYFDTLKKIRKNLGSQSAHYENTILLGDFSLSIEDPHMEHFRESCSFKRIMKGPTCFKKSGKSFCINLILINSPYNFQNCCAMEKGLSNFHKMIDSVMKTTFQKLQPKIVQ